jgi:hypothetical protein
LPTERAAPLGLTLPLTPSPTILPPLTTTAVVLLPEQTKASWEYAKALQRRAWTPLTTAAVFGTPPRIVGTRQEIARNALCPLAPNCGRSNALSTGRFQDYREAMRLFPERAGAYTGFAWPVATKDFPERTRYREAASAAAERAVALRRIPDDLDTLACAYAFAGDFPRAASHEREARDGVPSNSQYKRRLEQFEASRPADCTAAE